jgi:hypothetical protein
MWRGMSEIWEMLKQVDKEFIKNIMQYNHRYAREQIL